MFGVSQQDRNGLILNTPEYTCHPKSPSRIYVKQEIKSHRKPSRCGINNCVDFSLDVNPPFDILHYH